LPYDAVPTHRVLGLSLEHGLIRERMLKAVSALPNVMVKHGSRVVGIDQSQRSHLLVDVANGRDGGRYRCRLLVVADGSPSRLARMAGITVRRRRISTIWGYRIGTDNYADRSFGQVFLGAATPILVYPIGNNQARVLFDIPYTPERRPTADDCHSLAKVLPDALRVEVTKVIESGQRLSVLTQATCTMQSARGGVVLVGDAGGACHPLTATGMTMCISDALMLQRALARRPRNSHAALRQYARRRRWPQATRLVLAGALRDALCGETPALRVLQGGILALWRDSAAGRAATLALLSTADGRPIALLRQIAGVTARGFVAYLRNPSLAEGNVGRLQLTRELIASLLRHLREVLLGPRMPEAKSQSLRKE
jgi:2-polyprenyl-6-methoxyphenol hydroxylase-like FAD-dependent oxidoreductase